MKKAMVISHDRIFRELKARLLRKMGYKATTTDHFSGVRVFENMGPDLVIVFDYSERDNFLEHSGKKTYDDIKSSASPEQKIIRCGFETHNYADYVRLPCQLTKIIQKIS